MILRIFRFIRSLLAWGIRIFVMLTLLRYSTFDLSDPWNVAFTILGDSKFDYVGWEVGALAAKVDSTLYGLHPYMDETQRSNAVRNYMTDLQQAQLLEREVNAIYADPDQANPEAASADLRVQRDALRDDLRSRQSLVEAILEGQVASVLVDEGFGFGGQLLPPISMRFTEVPNVLVVSPRGEIRFDISINLVALPVDEQEALEARVDEALDVSSLILPLGGIALYPAMILETTNVAYTADTFSHEWLHHYLFAFPLGYSYDFGNETRIINETTANLFGRAIAPLVLRRYYPEYATTPIPEYALETPYSASDSAIIRSTIGTTDTTAPMRTRYTPALQQVFAPYVQETDPFDYGAEMNETRIRADELLAAGEIAEAEAYMEERRRLFVENGYLIRKLNQAFFAFYGGYQSESGGEGGGDPIGPAVAAIRDASPSLHEWIETMRGITTREQLLAACRCGGDT